MKRLVFAIAVILFLGVAYLCRGELAYPVHSSLPLDDSLLLGFALSGLDARDEYNRPLPANSGDHLFDLKQTVEVVRMILGNESLLFRVQLARGAVCFSDQPVLPPLAAVEFNLPKKGWPIRSISLLLPGNGRDRFSLNSSVSRIDSAIISSAEKIPTDLPFSDSPQKFEVLRL